MDYWENKFVLVTGGSAGLGRAVAQQLLERKANVVIVGRDNERLEKARRELAHLGGNITTAQADITRQEDVARLFANHVKSGGNLDCLINCAGRSMRKGVREATVEDFTQLMEINLLGTVRCTQAAMPSLIETKCRRRDIQDIFLGTGLGPRSYSIIEQGMVGRIVESRPEDLRILIEEAAGISKYRERRRETENRISHTRANLERVEDLMAELKTQLRRLKRQANDAKRYKDLRAEERELKSTIAVLQWLALSRLSGERDAGVAKLQTEMEGELAGQRKVETAIESLRVKSANAAEEMNTVQARYYELGAEISSIEQAMAHAREKHATDKEELGRVDVTLQRLGELQTNDMAQLQQAEARVRELEPDIEAVSEEYIGAESMLSKIESSYQDLQMQWDMFGSEAQQPERVKEVEQQNIKRTLTELERLRERNEHLLAQQGEFQSQLDETGLERARADMVAADQQFERLQAQLAALNEQLSGLRQAREKDSVQHNQATTSLEKLRARLHSLEEIQLSALAGDEQTVEPLLQRNGMHKTGVLVDQIRVAVGWEAALDALLGERLSAVTVSRLDLDASSLGEKTDVCLIEPGAQSPRQDGKFPAIISKVEQGADLIGEWLNGIYAAEHLPQALSWRSQLDHGEIIICRDGTVLGRNWIEVRSGGGAEQSVMVRSSEIDALKSQIESEEVSHQASATALEEQKQQIRQTEQQRDELDRQFQQAAQSRTELHNAFGQVQARTAHASEQLQRVTQELDAVLQGTTDAEQQIVQSRNKLQEAEKRTIEFAGQREQLITLKEQAYEELSSKRGQLNTVRERKQSVEMEFQRLDSSRNALTQNLQRLAEQINELEQRKEVLGNSLKDGVPDDTDQKQRLQSLMGTRLVSEKELAARRDTVTGIENEIREQDKQRMAAGNKVEAARQALDKARFEKQELDLKRDAIRESDEFSAEILAQIENAETQLVEEDLQQKLSRLSMRIERIGPVNLVAIEEFKEASERKEYLDSQCADLVESLETLEGVISKIDRETRALFKQTFDALNERFQAMFPRLFGGGKASLEMTGSDLLTTGVTVMARPPGKRNSTIHLLSGGEKALTAVSLLFGFFELNPAPFCVLDEVDAPLDDANVERYAGILKNLSEKTQILFVTHNKITMESADVLVGVTMNEPGVSRTVSVDVQQAVEMAAV